MSDFEKDVTKFNEMYKLPLSAVPTLDWGVRIGFNDRFESLKEILLEEINKIDDINSTLHSLKASSDLDILAPLAVLLGNIQVYCASEMAKYGLPLDRVQSIIMQSYFSKLGTDGNPIYDERGKILNGPEYLNPEPIIRALLTKVVFDAVQASSVVHP